MSITRNEMLGHTSAPLYDFPINPDIDSRWHSEIFDRIRSWLQTRGAHPLWGVCGGLYVTTGGHYDHEATTARFNNHHPDRCFPIEYILNVRPAPATTHSHWEINQ